MAIIKLNLFGITAKIYMTSIRDAHTHTHQMTPPLMDTFSPYAFGILPNEHLDKHRWCTTAPHNFNIVFSINCVNCVLIWRTTIDIFPAYFQMFSKKKKVYHMNKNGEYTFSLPKTKNPKKWISHTQWPHSVSIPMIFCIHKIANMRMNLTYGIC